MRVLNMNAQSRAYPIANNRLKSNTWNSVQKIQPDFGSDHVMFGKQAKPQVLFTVDEATNLLRLLLPEQSLKKLAHDRDCNLSQFAYKLRFRLQDCSIQNNKLVGSTAQINFRTNGEKIKNCLDLGNVNLSSPEEKAERLLQLSDELPLDVFKQVFRLLQYGTAQPNLAWQMADTLADSGLFKVANQIATDRTATSQSSDPPYSTQELTSAARIVLAWDGFPWQDTTQEATHLLALGRAFQPDNTLFGPFHPDEDKRVKQSASKRHRIIEPQFEVDPIPDKADASNKFIAPEHLRDWLRLLVINRLTVHSETRLPDKHLIIATPREDDSGFDVVS